MTFREAVDAMSRRKVAMLGGSEELRIVHDDTMRLLCAGTGVDYDDVNAIAQLLAVNVVHMVVADRVPLVPALEGMLIDALLTGHLAGSEGDG